MSDFKLFNLGRCAVCRKMTLLNEGMCPKHYLQDAVAAHVATVYPQVESYTPTEGPLAGVTVIDFSRVDLFQE
jgi:hypothetical protein